jgi:2,6-dihydroxypyridine 3-monooxygenase
MKGVTPRVVVMGGSLGGLTAALTLRDAGCEVAVYERSHVPLAGQGAGIVLNLATVRYFTRRSNFDINALSVATRWVRYMGQRGETAHEQPFTYRFSSYNALYRGLLDCFEADHYHLGDGVVGFEQDDYRVNVQLAGGQQINCDLLVCADGIRSTARQRLLPGLSLAYAGYIAWRGTVSEAEVSPQTYTQLRQAITYHLLPNSHVLIYPIPVVDQAPGAAGPQAHLNWLWYSNVSPGPPLDELMTDREGTIRDISLPPGMVQERHIAQLRADSATLPPPLTEIIHATAQPFIQAIVDLESPRMRFGRICLIGDAAFVARPHAAAGTAKAAEDAWMLSAAMREANGDVKAALYHWELGQLQLGRRVVERTREAGHRLQVESSWRAGEPLPFGLYEIGDSVMPAP